VGRVREMWDPHTSAGKDRLRHHAEVAGNFKANVVGRREVVRDEASLREEAGDHFDHFWESERKLWSSRTDINDANRLDVGEMRRIYVASYVKGYLAKIAEFDREDQYWREKEAKTERGEAERVSAATRQTHGKASVRVNNARHFLDAQLYEIELVDPEYLAGPVRFEIVVRAEGEPELRASVDDV
jgi:hypothetical protein